MANPASQTRTLIATEALLLAGHESPSAALLTRAEDEWLRRVVQMIYKRAELSLFEEVSGITFPVGVRTLNQLPSTADSITEIRAFTGVHTGISTATSIFSVTLAADEDITEDAILGRPLFLTATTPSNDLVYVIAYNETTKVASVSPSFSSTPANQNTSYLIADRENVLNLAPMSGQSSLKSVGLPTEYYIYDRQPTGVGGISLKELSVNRSAEVGTTNVLIIRYQVPYYEIDVSDARLTVVYNEMQAEITQGVYVEALKARDDQRYMSEKQIFDTMIEKYVIKNNREKNLRRRMFRAV